MNEGIEQRAPAIILRALCSKKRRTTSSTFRVPKQNPQLSLLLPALLFPTTHHPHCTAEQAPDARSLSRVWSGACHAPAPLRRPPPRGAQRARRFASRHRPRQAGGRRQPHTIPRHAGTTSAAASGHANPPPLAPFCSRFIEHTSSAAAAHTYSTGGHRRPAAAAATSSCEPLLKNHAILLQRAVSSPLGSACRCLRVHGVFTGRRRRATCFRSLKGRIGQKSQG